MMKTVGDFHGYLVINEVPLAGSVFVSVRTANQFSAGHSPLLTQVPFRGRCCVSTVGNSGIFTSKRPRLGRRRRIVPAFILIDPTDVEVARMPRLARSKQCSRTGSRTARKRRSRLPRSGNLANPASLIGIPRLEAAHAGNRITLYCKGGRMWWAVQDSNLRPPACKDCTHEKSTT